jgi:hypothetical protein
VRASPAPRNLFHPGTIVTYSGKYRVHHSSGHRPDTETFLGSGLILPRCAENGCEVSFELVFAAIDQIELMRFKAAS